MPLCQNLPWSKLHKLASKIQQEYLTFELCRMHDAEESHAS